MSENHQADVPPGYALLIGGIFEDAQKLVRQEVALARGEVARAWDKTKTGAALLVGALAIANVVGVLLGLMLVKFLQEHLLPNQEWACYGLVGGLGAIFAAALAYFGLRQISQVHLSLPQTTESLREDAQAVSEAVSGGRPAPHTFLNRSGGLS